jgi:hypothetical protein
VGSVGNAPVRRFRLCFVTPDLQSGGRITSQRFGSGGGSCAHGGRAYEARLNLILPAVEIGGVGGYRARINLLAGQVHCALLVCHDPK